MGGTKTSVPSLQSFLTSTTCLKRYTLYTQGKCTVKKESDLPPEELEEFRKVWDPDRPRRCRECSGALPGILQP